MHSAIFVKSNNVYHRIEIDRINLIQSDGNYVIIQTEDDEFTIKKSLVQVIVELKEANFIQIHKRFVVNKVKITALDTVNNELFIGKQAIAIGRTFKADLINNLRIW